MAFDFNHFAAVPNRYAVTATQLRLVEADERAAGEIISAAARLMRRVRSDRDLSDRLLAHGFGPGDLVTGITLQVAAEDLAELCGTAWQTLQATQAERDAVWVAAREDYLEFRETVRLECADADEARTLLVGGHVPGLLPDFLAQAAASYQVARHPRFAALLDSRGFTVSRLLDTTELLQQLIRLEELLCATHARVERLVQERSVAIGMLNYWMHDLLKSMRSALRHTCHPPQSPLAMGPRISPARRHRRASGSGVSRPLPGPEGV